jgi:predicted metalloprotease with PDZ domain
MKKRLMIFLATLPILFGMTTWGHAMDSPAVVSVSSKASSRGWLGVSIQDMTSRLARSMDVKTREGALVNNVVEDSPADSAGIREEDIIIKFAGTQIEDAADLTNAVRKTAPGTRVSVEIMRADEKKTLDVTVGRLPRRERRAYSFAIPPVPRLKMFRLSEMFGLELMELNDQLAEYFEVPEREGVLVEEVERNSAGDRAGFKAGDVIIKADKEPVDDVNDIRHALRSRDEGDKVEFEVIRKGTRKTLTLEVDEAPLPHRYRFNMRPHSEMFDDFDFDFDFDVDCTIDAEVLDEVDHHWLNNEVQRIGMEVQSIGNELRKEAQRLEHELRQRVRGVLS